MEFFSVLGVMNIFKNKNSLILKLGENFLTKSFRSNAPNLYENLWFRV
jgi:hypothetical protein